MKKAIVLFLVFLVLAVPSFAKNEGTFVKNEDLCLEVAQLAKGCVDVGIKNARIKNQCELVPSLMSVVKNEYAKRNISISEDLFNVLVNLCVELCVVAEKNRNIIPSQNLERIKNIISTTAYNVCVRSSKKQQKRDIVE